MRHASAFASRRRRSGRRSSGSTSQYCNALSSAKIDAGVSLLHFFRHGVQAFPPVGDDGDPVGELGGVEDFLPVVADALDAGQDVLFVGDPGEGRLVEQHLGEDDGGHLVVDQRGIDGQLRLGDALLGPVADVDRGARLVVDDDLAAVVQAIDAVDDHFDLDFLDLDFGRLFAGNDFERQRASALDAQPDVEQPGQAGRFELAEASGQRDAATLLEALQGGADGLGDGSPAAGLVERGERRRSPDGRPQGFQCLMHQRAASGRVKSLDRLVHRLASEPVLVIGPGRTDRLRAEQPAAPGHHFAFGDRRRLGIFEQFAGSAGLVAKLSRQRDHLARRISGQRYAGNQRTRSQDAIAVGPGIRKCHVRRGQRQAGMHPLREIELDLGAGVRRAGRAQQFGRQQRVGARRRRPEVVVHAHHPQGVEFEPGALEDPKHLNGRLAARFRLEDALLTQLRQAAYGLVQRQLAEQAIKPPEAVENLAKRPPRLKLVTGQLAIAGPAGRLQGPAENAGPLARMQRSRHARHHVDERVHRRHRLRAQWWLVFGQASGQPDHGRQGGEIGQIAAQRGVKPGAPLALALRRRPAAGQQQRRQPALLDLGPTAAQGQQIEGNPDQRQVGEPAAERKVEAARRLGGIGPDQRRMQRVVERELQPVAHAGQVGGDDAEPARRVGREMRLCPGGDGCALGGDIGAGQHALGEAVRGCFRCVAGATRVAMPCGQVAVGAENRLVFNCDSASGQRRHQLLFEGRKAVEARENHGGRQGKVTGGDQLDQLQVQAGRIAPVGGPAPPVEFHLPGGKVPGFVGKLVAGRADVPQARQRVGLGSRARHALDVEERGGLGQRSGNDLFPEHELGEGVKGSRQIANTAEQRLVGQGCQPLPDGQRPPCLPDRLTIRRLAAQGLGEAGGGAEGQAVAQASAVSSRVAWPAVRVAPAWPVPQESLPQPVRQSRRVSPAWPEPPVLPAWRGQA